MPSASGIRYGNEWFEPGSRQLRIEVATDGFVSIPVSELTNRGFVSGAGDLDRLQLFHLGREIPLDVVGSEVRFHGEQARSDLDRHLFEFGEEQLLNTRFNLFTDTAAYYLSVTDPGQTGVRFQAASGPGTGQTSSTVYRSAERIFSENQSKYFRRTAGNSIYFSHYDLAEGFGSRRGNDLLSSNGSTLTSLTLDLPEAEAGQAVLSIRFGLGFGDAHDQSIRVNGTEVGNLVTGEDWSVQDTSLVFNLASNQASITVEGRAGAQDKANMAYAAVRYPARAVVTGPSLSFTLPAGPATVLAPSGNVGGDSRLYDLTNGLVYGLRDGQFDLPASSGERRFELVSGTRPPAAMEVITLEQLLPPAETNYLILSSRRLQGSGLNELAAYRASAAGGGYRVHTVFVEDLYDAFGYGLRRHPQSIRNYLFAALERAPSLNYLFIVGKGREYPSLRSAENLAAAWSTFFVPGFGFPSSDNLLSAELGDVRPKLATGRLSAINDAEITLYLRKLIDVESQLAISDQSIEDKDWMKQALFLGGGSTASEQSAIQYNLGTMEEILENSKFGGNVTTLFKTNSEPIEEVKADLVFNRINDGLSLLTFYGHSSSQGFDFNIDNPDNYHNKDKYPFMLSLGCYSGDAFTEARSISERFILLPDGGAVAYAASKGLGYISALGTFGRSIFTHLSEDLYGEGVGDIIRASIEEFAGSSNFTLGILMEQFALSGDPAFRMHPQPGPDLVIDPGSVKFNPEVIPAQDSTFGLTFKILNLGTREEGLPDSMQVHIVQELPTGEERDLGFYSVPVPYYDKTVSLDLRNVGLEAIGSNRLFLSVDATDVVSEVPAGPAEGNNDLLVGGQRGVPFTVISNTAKVAFPPEYAVVGPGVELISGSSDPLAPIRTYVLQIAQDAAFNEIQSSEILEVPGGVIRYVPTLNFQDSTTYYWRISPDSTLTLGKGYLWSESSFTYISDQPQSELDYALQHPGQLTDGTQQNLTVPAESPTWSFGRNVNRVELRNAVYQSPGLPQFRWNTIVYPGVHNWRVTAGVQVLVIDSTDNSQWSSYPGDRSFNAAPGRGSAWPFDTRTEAGRDGLMRFLDEFVQEGQYVIFWSVQRGADIEYHSPAWTQDSLRSGRTIYGMLEKEGAEQVRFLETLGSVPYTFFYQKGKGPLAEAVGSDQTAETYLPVVLRENWDNGTYTTPAVGPSKEWRDMNLVFRSINIESADSAFLDLEGRTKSGDWEFIRKQDLPIREQLSYNFDLSSIDAEAFKFLRVRLHLFDPDLRTIPTVDELYVHYQRTGDVAISPAVAYSVPDTLAQGELALMEIGYENISPIAMDSMLIELTVLDDNNAVTRLSRRRPALAGNAQDTVQFQLPTASVSSGLRVQLLLNPEQDQPEEVLFNNLLTTDLGVGTDRVAPDLKVYFDGRRISNGELVSAQPEILIQLRDENQFRRLDDSSAYEIELFYPGQGGSGERIRMSDERVEYIAAPNSGDNMAEIYFRPDLTADGTYRLKVQAKDRSSNNAGRFEYEQEFEVLNEQLITNVLTYPNPFTTQTRFVYTLTGREAPKTFRIQIMTISGRVVRDIDLLAYEEIKVGTHRTQFTWDGTDEYGDQLANGVYLYRVIASDDSGAALESHRESGNQEFRETHAVTDQYFKNGMGKVVILR